MLATIVTALIAITAGGYTGFQAWESKADREEVLIVASKADYILTQQIDSVKDKIRALRAKYKAARPVDRDAIKIDLDYWQEEMKRLEAVQKGEKQ